jgi:hypothetical protein
MTGHLGKIERIANRVHDVEHLAHEFGYKGFKWKATPSASALLLISETLL